MENTLEQKINDFKKKLESIDDPDRLKEISQDICRTIDMMEISDDDYPEEDFNYCYSSLEAVKERQTQI